MSNEYNCHLEVATQILAITDCVTALILNSIKGVKKYCQFKLFIQSALVGFTVNLGVLQLINISLAQLIDPGLLFARPLGLTSSEHPGVC